MLNIEQKRDLLNKIYSGEIVMPNIKKGVYLPVIESGYNVLADELFYVKAYNKYRSGNNVFKFEILAKFADVNNIKLEYFCTPDQKIYFDNNALAGMEILYIDSLKVNNITPEALFKQFLPTGEQTVCYPQKKWEKITSDYVSRLIREGKTKYPDFEKIKIKKSCIEAAY